MATPNLASPSKPAKSSLDDDLPKSEKPEPNPQIVKRHILPTIEIVEGCKQYGLCGRWQQVLQKFNLTVYQAELYALLGPYGCGKSTVLNVILGLKSLDSGQVTVFGFKPGQELSGIPGIRVGYTPQSSGLYSEFTVIEILRYYGALLNLKQQYVTHRIAFLSNLLDLPRDRRYIKHCTEGTKRQISFAVALLHEPELLILDEPCAGVDPLLRQSMWEHMKQLVKEDKTILVTTQSCEEAGLADKVGFMRNGHLLIDGEPKELLKETKEKHMENLYRSVYSLNIMPLKPKESILENPLIKLEPVNITASEGFVYTGDASASEESFLTLQKHKLSPAYISGLPRKKLYRSCLSCKRLGVLLLRDLARSRRNYEWLFLFLLLPSFFLLIFCATIGTTPTSLPVGVVNYEASNKECLKESDFYLSCQLLELVDQNIIDKKEFYSKNDAIAAAQNLEISAILTIQKTFSEYINKVFTQVVLDRGSPTTEHAPIVLSLDLTNRIIANTIEITIKRAITDYLHLAAKGTEVDVDNIGCPLKVGEPIFGTTNTTNTEFMAPGLAVLFVYHSAAFVAALTLVIDRVNKIGQRNYLAGVRLGETIVSQMIVNGLVSMLQAVMLLAVVLVVFGMPHKGSLASVALVVLIQIWCGISFGIFVSMISKSTVGAGLYVFSSIVVTLILCGIQWPVAGLPKWLHAIIEFLPQTKAIAAVRSILQKGIYITHKQVYLGIIIPICWLCLFTVGCAIVNSII